MIDAHHHLWRYDPVEYGWIDGAMAALRRDFLPSDFDAAAAGTPVVGAVAVQARTCAEETDFLLAMAERRPAALGVVGWVDLKSEQVEANLDRYADQRLLRGVREVCQGRPDDAFFDHADFNRGVAALAAHGLTYDILVYEHQLPAAIRFADRHPHQPFVLDHCGKPVIRAGSGPSLQWSEGIRELARRPNVWCKLSGLATEVRDDGYMWDTSLLRPYVGTVLEAFGPSRVMFGSDWPVCLLATGYERWVAAVADLLSPLSLSERERVLGGSAREFYRLNGVA